MIVDGGCDGCVSVWEEDVGEGDGDVIDVCLGFVE